MYLKKCIEQIVLRRVKDVKDVFNARNRFRDVSGRIETLRACKTTQNRPKIIPKSSRNLPEIGPKSVREKTPLKTPFKNFTIFLRFPSRTCF